MFQGVLPAHHQHACTSGVVVGDVLAEGEALVLEEISSGQRLSGVIPGDSVTVIATQWHGRDAVELTFRPTVGHLDQRILYRADEPRLEIARSAGRPFDALASDFKLAAEAQR
ncbi:hypothetical protein, partial [Kocuria rosea]|uniref:hypothetical protein n=1 Tax=Kocuria rosea TaxID=1275 RepID=UPI00203B2DE3|nr:hypothetical protein [Kocuria rosea]